MFIPAAPTDADGVTVTDVAGVDENESNQSPLLSSHFPLSNV